MKKSVLVLFILLVSLPTVVAIGTCNLDVSLINQDPYPAIPGDYVKVVFQIDGVSNPYCQQITFELIEEYPLIFDEGANPIITFSSGFYEKDYSSFLIAPYKVRVDENALDGANPMEVRYNSGASEGYGTSQFNLEIEDARVDFEIFVKDYDLKTKQITFQILNIGDSDIEGLTLEIPSQENVVIRGANVEIAGDLDSNEYTTVDFYVIIDKKNIDLKVLYSDATNTRRTLGKTIDFEEDYFAEGPEDKESRSIWLYLFWIVIIGYIAYYFYKKRQRKKNMPKHHK